MYNKITYNAHKLARDDNAILQQETHSPIVAKSLYRLYSYTYDASCSYIYICVLFIVATAVIANYHCENDKI